MPSPLIHGRRGFVAASSLLDAAGASLTAIKNEDGLSWKDIGSAIDKSEDQAAKYGSGMATMDFVTFIRCCERWNGRFANGVLGLVDMHISESSMPSNAGEIRRGMLALTELLAGLQRAMLDEILDDDEIEGLDQMIEAAGEMLDSLRKRLSVIRSETVRAIRA